MAIQIIFCMETTKKADTDSIYISETLRHLYQLSNQIKISKIYMRTKSKYNARNVLQEISTKTKTFNFGDTRVIYCIDTDDYERSTEHKKELTDISHFCKEHGYDLIWFCHDVEEVFVGQKVSDSQKVQEAGTFRRKGKIGQIPHKLLSSDVMRVHTSNILTVLDKYLARK